MWKTTVIRAISGAIIGITVWGFFMFTNHNKHLQKVYSMTINSTGVSSNIVEQLSDGVPKGYVIQYNEHSKQYRWCTDRWLSYCSQNPQDSKEEALRWLDTHIKKDLSQNDWKTIK